MATENAPSPPAGAEVLHPIEIIPVAGSDLEAVLEIYRQCEDFLALGPVALASPEMVLEDIRHSREEGGIYCVIRHRELGPVGVVDYIPGGFCGDPGQGFISLLMVGRPFRNTGLGSQVLGAVEERIVSGSAIRAIGSGVQINNPRAIRFWQRHGYRITSGPRHMADGTDAFDLRKEIAPGSRA